MTSPPSPRTRSGPRTSPGISRPGTGRACLSPPVDCHDGGIVACTAGSGPDAGLADGMPVKAAETLPEGAKPLVHSDRGLPLPVPRMAGPHGTARPGAVDGREGPFPGQRRRRGVLRQDEDGIRPSRALGGTTPRRDARPGRRLHPLARPRAHQTVARLDEPGTIPPEPGNGRVIIQENARSPLSQGLSEYVRDWGNNLIRNIGICGGAALTYAYAALVSSSVGGVKGLRFSALRNEFGRRLFLGFERRYP